MGDGRTEGSPAVGDGGQAATSLVPDADGKHVRISKSSQLEGVYVGDLLVTENQQSCGIPGQCTKINYISTHWRQAIRKQKM